MLICSCARDCMLPGRGAHHNDVPACCAQDVAIAHGYNNLAESEPRIWGAGSELPLSQLSEAMRLEAAMAGFTEARLALIWALLLRRVRGQAQSRPCAACRLCPGLRCPQSMLWSGPEQAACTHKTSKAGVHMQGWVVELLAAAMV